ncbi:MAG: glycoside hydrolase family 2 protein [Clostridia bacterium]|nr:glycoside hydrolase family 2 protein [Clostridia bacterium]
MVIDIGKGWKYIERVAKDETGIPAEAENVDLPLDLLRRKNRNYHTPLGEYGSYYDAVAVTLYKKLPTLEKSEWIVLELEGVDQIADVYINGITVAHVEGDGKHFIDITEYYRYGAQNVVKLCVWAPQLAGRYTGAGISGGVRLRTHAHAVALRDDGAYVVAETENGRAHITVNAEVCDKTGEWAKKPFSLEAVVLNARGKKTARKIKKFKLKAAYINLCETTLRLSRFYTWSVDDPYLYTLRLILRDTEGNVLDESESTFGIVDRTMSTTRGLVLNGRGVKLKGAVVSRDNGILGKESTPSAEEFKLSRIKEIGYNAVRYVGCPTEAALDTLDKLGLMAVVDLFGVWNQGQFPYDGHVRFAANAAIDTERAVCTLRKHPCVVAYGLGDDAAETYGRGEGSKTAQALAEQVRSLDWSRPVVVNACERVPLPEELAAAGIKGKPQDSAAAIGMGREKDLFGKLTEPSFACGDIAGYAYLYPRYSSDRSRFPDRLILGTACYPSRAFEAFEECEKNANVVGEFVYCAADYLGYPLGKPVFEDEQLKLLPPHCSFCGDLDLIYNRKPAAYYRSIMLGNRSESCIAVSDPESRQTVDKAGYSVKQAHCVWNWPHNLGKPMEVEVYSGGEVVALYRDGKLIGRKLAGKVNKHVATFKTEYYPGTVEAVGYHKGRECGRVTLESVTAPRAVKLSCARKARKSGELFFVEIAVTDKEGRVVPYASREVEIAVSGQGELYAIGSADPESQNKTAETSMCAVYEGRALAVIRAFEEGDGKITVKATGDGLLSGKIALRVR